MFPCLVDKGLLRFRQLLFAFPHDAVIRVYDEAGNVVAITPQLVDGPMRMSCPFNLFFGFDCFTSTE